MVMWKPEPRCLCGTAIARDARVAVGFTVNGGRNPVQMAINMLVPILYTAVLSRI